MEMLSPDDSFKTIHGHCLAMIFPDAWIRADLTNTQQVKSWHRPVDGDGDGVKVGYAIILDNFGVWRLWRCVSFIFHSGLIHLNPMLDPMISIDIPSYIPTDGGTPRSTFQHLPAMFLPQGMMSARKLWRRSNRTSSVVDSVTGRTRQDLAPDAAPWL